MKILSSDMAQHYQVNSLQRGHLIFTSFISINGQLLFLDSHIERLLKGAHFLFPHFEWDLNFFKIKDHVENIFIKLNSLKDNFYFRLTIFDDCLYLQHRVLEESKDSLKLTTAIKIRTQGLIPPFLKLSHYVEADLELAQAKLKDWDDIVYMDNEGNLAEASSSNVFIVNDNGTVLTPPPSSMILGGITRKKLLEKLQKEGVDILEAPVSQLELFKAREIWLTNAVKGLRFVEQFDDRTFLKNNSLYLRAKAIFGRYGELV